MIYYIPGKLFFSWSLVVAFQQVIQKLKWHQSFHFTRSDNIKMRVFSKLSTLFNHAEDAVYATGSLTHLELTTCPGLFVHTRCDLFQLYVYAYLLFFSFCQDLSFFFAFLFSPTKITLIGAVLFALQQTHYLPLQKHHLMFIYTIFIVVNKVSLMPNLDSKPEPMSRL